MEEIKLEGALNCNLPAIPVIFVGLDCLGHEYSDMKVTVDQPAHMYGFR